MDWGSLLGDAVLLGVIAFVLQLLWRTLLGLLVFGPPAYAGVVIGYCVGALSGSPPLAALTAIAVFGALAELVCERLRSLRWRR